jgi:peptidyl-prolyl cis-trans isomerase A (cyclophilin A)
MKIISGILLFAFLIGCSRYEGTNPHVQIVTKYGDIELELFADKAPKTVAAFLRNIDSGWYRNSTFYRILSVENQPSDAIKTELIQGGVWKTKYSLSKRLEGTPHEPTNQTGILHTNGTISMARTEPGTATTEFFICIENQPGLDFGGQNNADGLGYAAFGRVVKGMDIVRKIYRLPEDDQAFDPPVFIFDIKRL